MSFNGALLKPSEKKGRQNAIAKMSTIVDKDDARFERLKSVVHEGLETVFEVGAALLEIKTDALYKKDFSTFEAFCESEFKIVRSRAYQLIKAAKVKASLPAAVADHVENEAQARALAAVPEEDRAEVIEAAAKAGPLTAERISETAAQIAESQPRDVDAPPIAPPSKAEPQKPKRLDKTGYVIPDSVLADWDAAEDFRSTLNDLHRVKLFIEKAVEAKEKPLRFLDQSVLIDLTNAWKALKEIFPYAVCPTCQGRARSKCTVCKELGYVPEFGYKHWFPKETIQLRERAIKK